MAQPGINELSIVSSSDSTQVILVAHSVPDQQRVFVGVAEHEAVD